VLNIHSHNYSKGEQDKEISKEEQAAIFAVLLGEYEGRSNKDDPIEQEISKGSKGNFVQDFCD
jgi:hypothetical protein